MALGMGAAQVPPSSSVLAVLRMHCSWKGCVCGPLQPRASHVWCCACDQGILLWQGRNRQTMGCRDMGSFLLGAIGDAQVPGSTLICPAHSLGSGSCPALPGLR